MPQSHTLIIILEQNTGSIATSNGTSSEQPGMQFPTKSAAFPILYREKDAKPPTSMTTIEGPHTYLRHEDKFLRTINANLYYGKGYPQYLHSENKEESIPVFEAVKKYILQDRPHLKGTHPIYNRMLREGIFKVPVLFTTQVIYANYASRFLYTFAKLCDNPIKWFSF